MSDGMLGFVVFAVVVGLMCGCVTGAIASGKGRSGAGWFVLGALFGPIAILAIAIASREDAAATAGVSAANEIERLAALRDRGDLTEEEFSSAKTRMLS